MGLFQGCYFLLVAWYLNFVLLDVFTTSVFLWDTSFKQMQRNSLTYKNIALKLEKKTDKKRLKNVYKLNERNI